MWIETTEGNPITVKVTEDLFQRETNSNESVEIILPDGRVIHVWGTGTITVTGPNGVEIEVEPYVGGRCPYCG